MTPGRVMPAVVGAAGRRAPVSGLVSYVGGVLEGSAEASLQSLFPLNGGTATALPPSVACPAGRVLSERCREIQEARTSRGAGRVGPLLSHARAAPLCAREAAS